MSNQTAVHLIIQWVQANSFNVESQSGANHIVVDVSEISANFESWVNTERIQHGTTWNAAIQAHEDRGHNTARSIPDFDEYQIQ